MVEAPVVPGLSNDLFPEFGHEGLSPDVLGGHYRDVLALHKSKEFDVTAIRDALPYLKSLLANDKDGLLAGALESVSKVIVLEVEGTGGQDEMLHSRRILLLENRYGNKSSISTVLHGGEAGGVATHFGGMGLYEKSPELAHIPDLVWQLDYNEGFAEVMTGKGFIIRATNADDPSKPMRGSKTIIQESAAWKSSEPFQIITGMMVGPNGAFSEIITGTDNGQNRKTIGNLSTGSEIAGGIGQIVGAEGGLEDTPGYYDANANPFYEAFQKYLPRFLGRVGHLLPDGFEFGLPPLSQVSAVA